MLVKTLIATFCVIGVALAEQTPVFLWGVNSAAKPALQTVTQDEFTAILSEMLKDHMVVAYQENGLTNKDFLCSNLKSAQSCYAQLQSVSPKTFYSGVENPVEALHVAATERESNSIDENGQLARPLECNIGKAVLVTFDSSAETREATLEAHDVAIASITKSNKCKTAYLYMAAPSTSPAPTAVKVRSRRDASIPVSETAAASGGTYFREGNQFLIFFQKVQYVSGSTVTPLTITKMSISNTTGNANQYSVTLTAEKTITFDIVKTNDGYYNLKNVAVGDVPFRSLGVNAPTTFSYYCGNLTLPAASTIAKPSTDKLIFISLQFQAPFNAKTGDNFVFGDAWHCVGFFTPGILGGLFVVLLLLSILFTGICWMMDINTMDRFDDPKGKTITISATE